jgi:hypothetical protein
MILFGEYFKKVVKETSKVYINIKNMGEEEAEFTQDPINLKSITEDFYFRKEIEQLIEEANEKGNIRAVDDLVEILWNKQPKCVDFFLERKRGCKVNYISPIQINEKSITVQAYNEDDPHNTYPVELSFYKEVLVHPV